jgi:hypothetical protein
MVVVCLLAAAFRFLNAPMVPFLYEHLYRLGLWLFVSHTLILTLCWKYCTLSLFFNTTSPSLSLSLMHTHHWPARSLDVQCGSRWA